MDSDKNPLDQYQCGEQVVYIPEGIVTRIEGFCWRHMIGGVSRLAGYTLDCGLDCVPPDLIRYSTPNERLHMQELWDAE